MLTPEQQWRLEGLARDAYLTLEKFGSRPLEMRADKRMGVVFGILAQILIAQGTCADRTQAINKLRERFAAWVGIDPIDAACSAYADVVEGVD